MALAAIWVLPIAFAIVALASRVQKNLAKKSMSAKIACEDGIQECMEVMSDLHANNAEQRYLSGLTKKIRAVESRLIASELERRYLLFLPVRCFALVLLQLHLSVRICL